MSSSNPHCPASEYALENINQAYEDMHNGVNLRGLIRF